MHIIDITRTVHEGMVVYEGDAPFRKIVTSVVSGDDPSTLGLSEIALGSHVGTHVDAPFHFVSGGATVDELPLESLCGPARVVDVSERGHRLDDAQLRELDLEGVRRVLFKTFREDPEAATTFDHDYSHLTAKGAAYLRSLGMMTVGIDSLSIDRFPKQGFQFPAHHALLDDDGEHPPVVIVEGLTLHEVTEGDYLLWCMPLKIGGADGAPARAILTALE